MKTVYEFDSTLITHREIHVNNIENTDFVFYEDVRDVVNNGSMSKKICKGITSVKNIQRVKGLNPIDIYVNAPRMYGKHAVVTAIKKETFERVKAGLVYILDAIEEINDVNYLDDKYMIVLWNWESHKIADLNYNFISIPITFNYIDGCVDDGHYDLDKLLEKLKNDPNVCNPSDLKIKDIPYYNCYEGHTQFISFKYLLSTADYNKVMNMDYFAMRKYVLDNIIGAKKFEKEK